MKSEEQWQEGGSCPDCGAPIYKMGEKFNPHICPYDEMDRIVSN